MNHYELLAIVDGRIADTELDGFRATLEETLKKHVSQIHYMHNLGRRKLAYPIKHQGHGTYLLCEFDAEGDAVKKIERSLSLTTELLRHCIERRKTVGQPIELERREIETRGRSPRKSQDEALLGKAPIEDVVLTAQAPVAQAPEPVEQMPIEEETPAPATIEETPAPTIEEQTTPEEGAKKKDQKASYEELDKKLNELLSDDII
ncbi:MAG: 30S ribosomal protein S6 [Patescibacteria group bacterium]